MEATWTRREGTNPDLAYRLFPGEDLSGPAYVDTDLGDRPSKLSGLQKEVLKEVNGIVLKQIELFPGSATGKSIVNPYTLWTAHGKEALTSVATTELLEAPVRKRKGAPAREGNSSKPNKRRTTAIQMLEMGNVDEHSTGFRKQMFQSFLSHVALQQEDTTFSEKNPRFTTVWNESSKIRLEFQRCYNAGQDARGQAFWIGLSRISPLKEGKLAGNILFETEELYQQSTQALPSVKIQLADDGSYNRICAPTSSRRYAFFFWQKDHPEDTEPRWDKLIGATLFNNTAHADFRKPEVQDAFNAISKRPFISRGMESLGGMAKASSGQFNNNGSACYLEYPVSKMGQNATEEMRKQHLEELKVREEMADNRPVTQGRYLEFTRGFMPQIFKSMKNQMKTSASVNSFGLPQHSSFAAFAYCAAIHTDNDAVASGGWVIVRDDSSIDRQESNFVYGSHRTILELACDQYWYWRATEDLHGTTGSSFALDNVGAPNFSSFSGHDAFRFGQWTRVNTIPSRLHDAQNRALG